MSAAAPGEIRLRVAYNNAETLLGEFTRSVGRGQVALESQKAVKPGTRFIFELSAKDVSEKIEVVGEVRQVQPVAGGKFLLTISYNLGGGRKNLDAVLQRIFDAHRFEKMRAHPRIPLSLRASEERPQSPTFLVRDVSLGGVGMQVESPTLPRQVHMDAPCFLEIWVSTGALMLHGEIVWVVRPPPSDAQKVVRPAFGVRFGKLRPETSSVLEQILRLRGLPPPPWRARVSFGLDAVARMPGSKPER